MIPQLHERVNRLECQLDERLTEINQLRDNLTELRQQLQVEREPCVASPVNTGGNGLLAKSRY